MRDNMHNEITYLYFRTLGGFSNPRCFKMLRQNGSHTYFTYHLKLY